MYQYTAFDQRIVDERVAQFRDQTERHLAGELSADDFKMLRLQNGLYIQKHAPMLRVAIPYGLVNTNQVRMFAHIARKYDRDYAHFSTRQNIQFNWPELSRVPDILPTLRPCKCTPFKPAATSSGTPRPISSQASRRTKW